MTDDLSDWRASVQAADPARQGVAATSGYAFATCEVSYRMGLRKAAEIARAAARNVHQLPHLPTAQPDFANMYESMANGVADAIEAEIDR